jgi:glycine dehydrogenase
VTLDETTSRDVVALVWEAFGEKLDYDQMAAGAAAGLPAALARSTPYLTHAVFNTHHSETELLRYMRKLADRDLALDRAMIPLGSCTMKLNATAEMVPVTWPNLSNVHPFAPRDQVAGYLEMCPQRWSQRARSPATPSRCSRTPAQGERGAPGDRGYHQSRGEGHRNIYSSPRARNGPASANIRSAWSRGRPATPAASPRC